MESLAIVLRRIPLFATLPPGSFAKIIADLREETYEAGAVICFEGDEASDFYIIKSGQADVYVNRGGNERELVAVNGPNEWFGERALFSDRPRSATVVARSAMTVWRLTKEKFDGLMEENPRLIMQFTQVLSDRLYRGNQELSKVNAAFVQQISCLIDAEPPEMCSLLLQGAAFRALDPGMLRAVLGEGAADTLLRHAAELPAVTSRRDGKLVFSDAVREFLLARAKRDLGFESVHDLQARGAAYFEQAGQWDHAVDLFIHAERFHDAARLVAAHADEIFRDERFDALQAWIAELPPDVSWAFLADVRRRFDERQAARSLASQGPVARKARIPAEAWTLLGGIIGVVGGVALWLTPPPEGLDLAGMKMLGLLAWAAAFWAFDVLPDYVVGLGLIIGWIVFGVVPAEVAVSGFTTSPFFLIIGVLGIGASLQSSGLLFRLALQVLQRFPLTHRGQWLGLALSGTAITPGIPDVTCGIAIASPIILALSDSLGYKHRSNGSAGIAMAAVLGFGQMSPFFLTGAAENLLAWGLLPEATRAGISWVGYFEAALPLAIVTFVLAFISTMLLLPTEIQPTVSRGLIATQIEALGPVSRAEAVNGAVLLGAIIGWVTAPYHGIDVAWVAMIGLAVLLSANYLDRGSFRAGIYWDFIFYLGAVLSLTSVVHTVGVDKWVVGLLTPILAPLAQNPKMFLFFVAIAVMAARFVLPSFPLVSVLVLTLAPIAMPAGIDALALILVICTCVCVWFLPYQSPYYLALYFGTKEKAFTHGQVRPVAWSYGLIYLIAIVVALPYWHWLGLIQ